MRILIVEDNPRILAFLQKGLREGRALKHLADDVGYGGEAALSRAFRAHTGQSPREWRKAALAGP